MRTERLEAASPWQMNTVQRAASKMGYSGDSTTQILSQKVFRELQHPGKSTQAKGREAYDV